MKGASSTGYHEVAMFEYGDDLTGSRNLPVGWKPYTNAVVNGRNMIVARNWHPNRPERISARSERVEREPLG